MPHICTLGSKINYTEFTIASRKQWTSTMRISRSLRKEMTYNNSLGKNTNKLRRINNPESTNFVQNKNNANLELN